MNDRGSVWSWKRRARLHKSPRTPRPSRARILPAGNPRAWRGGGSGEVVDIGRSSRWFLLGVHAEPTRYFGREAATFLRPLAAPHPTLSPIGWGEGQKRGCK